MLIDGVIVKKFSKVCSRIALDRCAQTLYKVQTRRRRLVAFTRIALEFSKNKLKVISK